MPSYQAFKPLFKLTILAVLTLGPCFFLASWADAMSHSLATARR